MTQQTHLIELQQEKLPNLNEYNRLLSQSFEEFRWVVFPVRTTLLQEDFLETSIERVKVDWSIFVNSMKAVVANDNALVAPISRKLIDSFKHLSESRASSQEAIILLAALSNFIQKIVDNAMLCHSTILNVKKDMDHIVANSDDAIIKCKETGRLAVARDINDLQERIQELLIPFNDLIVYSTQVLNFWIKIEGGVNKVIAYYKENSVVIDAISLESVKKSFNNNFKPALAGSNQPKGSFFNRLFQRSSSVKKNSEIRKEMKTHEDEQKSKLFLPVSNPSNRGSVSYNATISNSHSNNRLSLHDALAYMTMSSQKNTKNRNSLIISPEQLSTFTPKKRSFVANNSKTSVDSGNSSNSTSSTSTTTNSNSNSNSNINTRNSTHSLSNSSSTITSAGSESVGYAIPASSVYWIAKNINEVVSTYDNFVENNITLLETYLS